MKKGISSTAPRRKRSYSQCTEVAAPQPTQELPQSTSLQDLPQELLAKILTFVPEQNKSFLPQAKLVSRRFRDASIDAGILRYNARQKPNLFSYETSSDGMNQAVLYQVVDLHALLTAQIPALPGVMKCMLELYAAFKVESLPHKFLLIDNILENLNVAIIKSRIEASKQANPTYLDLRSPLLTRISGRLITDPAYQDYWRGLEKIDLGMSHYLALPSEMGLLINLKCLCLEMGAQQPGYTLPEADIPSSLFSLPSLERLKLCRAGMEVLPPEVGNLRQLKFLDVSHNNLQSLPTEITLLSNLESLYADFNDIDEWPSGMSKLIALRRLSLMGNKLTTVSQEIKQLSQLEHLNVYLNLLTRSPEDLNPNLFKGVMRLDKSKVLLLQRQEREVELICFSIESLIDCIGQRLECYRKRTLEYLDNEGKDIKALVLGSEEDQNQMKDRAKRARSI